MILVSMTSQLLADLSHVTSAIPTAGIVTSLEGMAAEQWEVRNAASLAFATLVLRTVGIRNVVKVTTPSFRALPRSRLPVPCC